MFDSIADGVAAGALRLDEFCPGWEERMGDLSTLDIGSRYNCVLQRAFGRYDMKLIGSRWCDDHWWITSQGRTVVVFASIETTEAWREEILARLLRKEERDANREEMPGMRRVEGSERVLA